MKLASIGSTFTLAPPTGSCFMWSISWRKIRQDSSVYCENDAKWNFGEEGGRKSLAVYKPPNKVFPANFVITDTPFCRVVLTFQLNGSIIYSICGALSLSPAEQWRCQRWWVSVCAGQDRGSVSLRWANLWKRPPTFHFKVCCRVCVLWC